MADFLRRVTAWALRLRLVRAYLVYSGRRGPMLADSVTYRTLFSVFAGVLIGFSFAALWLAGNPDALAALEKSFDEIEKSIDERIAKANRTAGLGRSDAKYKGHFVSEDQARAFGAVFTCDFVRQIA